MEYQKVKNFLIIVSCMLRIKYNLVIVFFFVIRLQKYPIGL